MWSIDVGDVRLPHLLLGCGSRLTITVLGKESLIRDDVKREKVKREIVNLEMQT